MATTDVAGSVLPVYTPTLPVTIDGDPFTQADLTALTLSLANRIEFLRDLADDAADTPETSVIVREDFHGAIWTSGAGRLDASFPWQTAFVGSPAVSNTSGTSAPGELTVQLPAVSTEFRYSYGAPTSTAFNFAELQHMTVKIKLTDDPSNLNTFFSIGFGQNVGAGNGGTNALQIQYLKGLNSTHWLLHKRKAGASVFTPIEAISAFYTTLRFVRVGSDMLIRDANNNLLATVLAADMPVGTCTFGGYHINSVADPALSIHQTDFIFIRSKPAGRQ